MVEQNVELIKGKAAKVERDEETGELLVTAEDVMSGKRSTARIDLLVLATGIVPNSEGLPEQFSRDEFQFLSHPPGKTGVYPAGCVRRPEEVSATVQDGTGAALKALQIARRSASHA